ncbi:uncharacterized protein B0H64DRAFT_444481 [Chaetomium fimeti]|uniref:Uncharacterized protein n=1 Tax=Chaetomium fimeti TaxID=1854472 RepID=A0AAE0HB53_9PEZI|nr:hypothetical protein B0H64DRAFT_444481 [Chaetomium fimeti]
MCTWELVKFSECRHSELQKMAYSCDIYRRHVYGSCVYDERYDRDRVCKVFSEGFCTRCSELFKYVNYEFASQPGPTKFAAPPRERWIRVIRGRWVPQFRIPEAGPEVSGSYSALFF